MGVVPAMLEGYGGEPTLAFKARIVRRHLQLALLLMPRGAVSDLSWAERGSDPAGADALLRLWASARLVRSDASGTTMRAPRGPAAGSTRPVGPSRSISSAPRATRASTVTRSGRRALGGATRRK